MDALFQPLYFTFGELTTTQTGLNNTPVTFSQVENLVLLGHVLDRIRMDFGYPIIVNSAFRTREVNDAVGGCSNSKHLLGLAADITAKRYADLGVILRKFHEEGWFKEFIEYPDKHFYHISLNLGKSLDLFLSLIREDYGR